MVRFGTLAREHDGFVFIHAEPLCHVGNRRPAQHLAARLLEERLAKPE